MLVADLLVVRVGLDGLGCIEEGGVEDPYNEFRVEEDFVVGTVPPSECSESLEAVVGMSDLGLAFLRRKSLKKGMTAFAGLRLSNW